MAIKMKTATFPRGGVHLPELKDRTKALPLERPPAPARVAVLMGQHAGAPATPVVRKRERVRKGQLLGRAQGHVSANVHSPVSGTVEAIEPRIYNLTGLRVPAAIIANDGLEKWAAGTNEPQDVEGMEAARMVELVRDCGVVGLGGAAFPSHVKLSPPAGMPITDVFVNGTECEPYVTVDHRLMLERTADVVDGLRLIMRIVKAANGYVAIERNKPDAIEALGKAVEGDPDIRVVPFKVRYPQGAEHQIITAVTGREVPSDGGLPAAVGCLVHNVATVLAIRDAVRFRRPLIERPITVTGDGIEEAGNLIEPIGASIADIIARQGVREGANQLILGGPMMGVAQGVADVPLVKGNSAIVLLREAWIPLQRDCIRCGRCIEQCPMGLVPGAIGFACESRDWNTASALGLLECRECGCCAYVCPAKRPIVQMIKFGKSELRRKDEKAKPGR
jgi:electron transport complex protein RnfC